MNFFFLMCNWEVWHTENIWNIPDRLYVPIFSIKTLVQNIQTQVTV